MIAPLAQSTEAKPNSHVTLEKREANEKIPAAQGLGKALQPGQGGAEPEAASSGSFVISVVILVSLVLFVLFSVYSLTPAFCCCSSD